ncbi:hypothetical protein DRE_03186 [Drechslerella stenobrocha 248]|uniref:Uncharacterized protein n=1 Tax=Drechslerella stenobrocha 248 TaxID=1043628 RepID=W7HTU2_9PEZI|nr:hypothetical protein DRE_03186 [Drechslerella stenobrocha 248]
MMHFSFPTTVPSLSSASSTSSTSSTSSASKPEKPLSWTHRSGSSGGSSPSQASSFTHLLKRRRRQLYLLLALALSVCFYLYSRDDASSGGGGNGLSTADRAAAKAAPTAVLVVAVDPKTMSTEYCDRIVENRRRYAARWGYEVFVGDLGAYTGGNEYSFRDNQGQLRTYPPSFNRFPIVRHAMASFPYTRTFWFLSSDSLIINMDLSLETHVLSRKRLNSLMLRDHPVIPPMSIIKTFKHNDADDTQLIVTQDSQSVRADSFIVRRKRDEMPGKIKAGKTVFGYYLMDVWFDPLYRYYHFKDAETSALEHMVQWHPTVLAKMALIPQRIMLSYPIAAGGNTKNTDDGMAKKSSGDAAADALRAKYAGAGYEPGDFVVHFRKCGTGIETDKGCKKEFERYWKMTDKYEVGGKQAGKAKGGSKWRPKAAVVAKPATRKQPAKVPAAKGPGR